MAVELKTIKLYCNTGFNSVDVPEDLKLVEQKGTLIKTLSNYNIIQTNNIATVTVEGITESECNSIDYVIISDSNNKTGYILSDQRYEYRADGVVKLFLIRDSFATIGKFNNQTKLIYATANRMSVKPEDDDEIYFTELEPYKPSERLTIIEGNNGGALDPSMSESVVNILETVVAPPKTVESICGGSIPTVDSHIIAVNTGKDVVVSDEGITKTVPIKTPSVPNRQMEGISTGEQMTIIQDNETKDITSLSRSTLITPVFRKIAQTLYTISKLFIGETLIRTGTMWWNGDNMEATWTDSEGIVHECGVLRDLRSAGADNGAVAFWAVNTNYIESMNDAGYNPASNFAGGITSIKSKIYNQTALFQPTFLNYKNNKIYYGQALSIKIFSPVSGANITKEAYEVRNTDNKPNEHQTRADYSIGADIRSGGAPIFAWKHINGEVQDTAYPETIQGGKWRQIPLAAVGAMGSAYDQFNLNKEKNNNIINTALGAMQGAIEGATLGAAAGTAVPGIGNIAGGIAGGIVGGVAGGFATYSSLTKQQLEQQALLNAQGNKADVALQISTSEYLREVGKNSFYNLFIIYSENDIKSFDRFLTLYGYKVNNREITEDDFDSRPYFNYLRLNEIEIKSNKFGIGIINEAKEQLKAGIRIWHTLPTEEAIEEGNKDNE